MGCKSWLAPAGHAVGSSSARYTSCTHVPSIFTSLVPLTVAAASATSESRFLDALEVLFGGILWSLRRIRAYEQTGDG